MFTHKKAFRECFQACSLSLSEGWTASPLGLLLPPFTASPLACCHLKFQAVHPSQLNTDPSAEITYHEQKITLQHERSRQPSVFYNITKTLSSQPVPWCEACYWSYAATVLKVPSALRAYRHKQSKMKIEGQEVERAVARWRRLYMATERMKNHMPPSLSPPMPTSTDIRLQPSPCLDGLF